MTNITKKTVEIKKLTKHEPFLFVELTNKRNFITDGKNVKEFSEFNSFIEVLELQGIFYIVLSNGYVESIINFDTQEVLITYDSWKHCFKKSESILKIGDKLFNLKTKDYIPNTENLEPNTFCILSDNLFLFDTTETDYKKRSTLILNEKGERLYTVETGVPEFFDNRLILRDKEGIKVIHYKEGKLDFDSGVIIKNQETKPYYYEGNIYLIKEKKVYKIDLNGNISNKYDLPAYDMIINSDREFNKLYLHVKRNNSNKIIIMDLNTGKYIETNKIGIVPFMGGPSVHVLITLDNKKYNETNQEVYQAKLYDEKLNLLYTAENVLDYDYLISNNEDKIWLKRKKDSIIYNVVSNKSITTNYNDIHFQTNDENNLNEYGFGINYENKLLQIIDEDFNILIESIPYEALGFYPSFGQFGYRYLNGYLDILQRKVIIGNYEITRHSIIDKQGYVIYDNQNVSVTSIGHYFQIIEKESTLYFDTLTGEFSTKCLNNANNSFLLETKDQFEITNDGSLKLIQKLK